MEANENRRTEENHQRGENNKSPGTDVISTQVLKLQGERAV